MQISVKINMSILTLADYVKAFLIYCDHFRIFLEVYCNKPNEKNSNRIQVMIFCSIKFLEHKELMQYIFKKLQNYKS